MAIDVIEKFGLAPRPPPLSAAEPRCEPRVVRAAHQLMPTDVLQILKQKGGRDWSLESQKQLITPATQPTDANDYAPDSDLEKEMVAIRCHSPAVQ
eukprot:SM011317S23953  [mRNA]  locus=s11317:70:374:- [translate_table: standard]